MDALGKAVGGTTAYRMDWIIIIPNTNNKTDKLELQIMDKDGYNSCTDYLYIGYNFYNFCTHNIQLPNYC